MNKIKEIILFILWFTLGYEWIKNGYKHLFIIVNNTRRNISLIDAFKNLTNILFLIYR